MDWDQIQREGARRLAERLRREYLTVEEAFTSFTDKLRGTRRGVRSRRQDLIRLAWCWSSEHRWGPLFPPKFPVHKILASLKFVENGPYNTHVPHMFCRISNISEGTLRKFMTPERAVIVRRALAGCAQEARLASYQNEISMSAALEKWSFMFGRSFPQRRTHAGLPLLP